jgi:Glucodextranase, domain B
MLRPTRAAALALACSFFAAFLLALAPAPAEAGRPRVQPPTLIVQSPANGTFTNAATITVAGRVTSVNPATAILTVNGTIVPLNSNGTFSYELPLNPSIVFNPIETRLVNPTFKIDRRVAIAGDSVADGDFSYESLALRLNDTGLDALEPVVTSLVDLDLASLVPPGTQVINEYCYASLFGLCISTADAYIEGSPPPSIGSFSIDIDSQPGMAYGDILLNNLFVRTQVQNGDWGIPFTCHINVSAATTDILGNYGLEPLATDPQYVDVQQLGGVSVVFGGFSHTTGCDGIFGGVIQFFIDLLVGDIQSLMRPAFENFLNTPDAAGNTPVAGAIETALSQISIAGPIGTSLNVALDAPLFEVAEDADGITLGADARIQAQLGSGPGQCTPPAGTPDLAASYHVDEAFPSFGATTPVGGLPYDLGISISTSAFNQLLKAQIECGLLQLDLNQFEFLGNTVPLTAGLLSLLLPEFGGFAPSLPLIARLQPSTAPVLTGNLGPHGENSELRVGQLVVDLRDDPAFGGNTSYLKLGVDFRVGLDFQFDDVTGQLVPVISTVDVPDVTVGVISSYFPTITPEDVQGVLPGVLAGALPLLSDTLGSFPIPSFFGLQLQGVETGRNGQFLAIFANLAVSP